MGGKSRGEGEKEFGVNEPFRVCDDDAVALPTRWLNKEERHTLSRVKTNKRRQNNNSNGNRTFVLPRGGDSWSEGGREGGMEKERNNNRVGERERT